MRDSVDKVIDDWRELRPDLDASPIGVVARLRRVRSHFDQELEALFAEHGLSLADFEVLATLRRLGGTASQRRLMRRRQTFAGALRRAATASTAKRRAVAHGARRCRPGRRLQIGSACRGVLSLRYIATRCAST